MKKKTQLGVFQGRSARYNKAIMKVLLLADRDLTSWEVAKGVREITHAGLNGDTATVRTQGIHSVLIRKGGRLYDLQKKGYVTLRDKKWSLKFPKGWAIMIAEPSLVNYLRPENMLSEGDINELKSRIARGRKIEFYIPKLGMRFGIEKKGLEEMFNEIVKRLKNPRSHQQVAECLADLCLEGFDIDRIEAGKLIKLVFWPLFEKWGLLQKYANGSLEL